jgi:hypothetical protein
MAAFVVTIICIAMIVVGGMTLSQGILTSADTAALNAGQISVTEGEIARTDLTIDRAAQLSWSDYLRVILSNSGQTKLANFDKWDVIVSYIDNDNNTCIKWLPYTEVMSGNNKWYKARIGLDGPTEYFEPGIFNPAEELVILSRLDPPPKSGTNIDISISTPNGVYSSRTFSKLSYMLLTAQSENTTFGNIKYYEMAEAASADGPAIIAGTTYSTNESARRLLYNIDDPTRPAKHVYPLIGISEIPKSTWTVYYHGFVGGYGGFPQDDGDVCFNIDIIVRKANGTIRDIIDSRAAPAFVAEGEGGVWMTFSTSYDFPGYTVVDQNDYLEIDYYGLTVMGPNAPLGYIRLSIDDSSLSIFNQTRIKAG